MELIQKLKQEHQLILNYINLFLNSEIDFEKSKILIDFIENYADKYHHAKEENILFVELEKPGVLSHCNPVRQMLFEHDQARHYVQQIKNGIQTKNISLLYSNIQNYCFLLQQHIYKEDHILYPMAEQNLSDSVKAEINVRFEKMERELKGSGISTKYEGLYKDLSQNLKIVLAKK